MTTTICYLCMPKSQWVASKNTKSNTMPSIKTSRITTPTRLQENTNKTEKVIG
jgi:hypothetical protein